MSNTTWAEEAQRISRELATAHAGAARAKLRDEFAMAALTGLAANSKWNVTKQVENCARSAYELADAMLEARNENR